MKKSKSEAKKRILKIRKEALLLIFLSLGVVVYGLVVMLRPRIEHHFPVKINQVNQNPTTSSATDYATSERPVSKDSPYIVPANQPRRIIIPGQKIDAFIQKVGTDSTGRMAAPNNINLAGWFSEGPKPGDAGVSIINGHVHGRYDEAVFTRLKDVAINQEFYIEFGDKSIKKFKIIDKKQVNEENATIAMFRRVQGITSQLNVITCGGRFNRTTQSYDDRIIIMASLM